MPSHSRTKNILKSKYGKTSEVVNAYVQNIMALPAISCSNPVNIQFYGNLLSNVRVLEMLEKLKEVNGNVRMSIDKLEGIQSDLVRTDDDWQTWDFPKFVDALHKWTERNPLHVKVNDKNWEPPSYPIYQTHQGDRPLRSCVYCDSVDHWSHKCSKVTQPSQRKRILQLKSLCFNCTGSDHKVT